MPKIKIVVDPKSKQAVEYTGKVASGWRCATTNLIFKTKPAYVKHLKQLAKDRQSCSHTSTSQTV